MKKKKIKVLQAIKCVCGKVGENVKYREWEAQDKMITISAVMCEGCFNVVVNAWSEGLQECQRCEGGSK